MGCVGVRCEAKCLNSLSWFWTDNFRVAIFPRQRQLLRIRRYNKVQNDEVLQWTGLTSLPNLLSCRCTSVFGHMARLDDDTLANMALQLHVNVSFNDTIRYDTRCYFNVCSKADISQLNLLHGTDN